MLKNRSNKIPSITLLLLGSYVLTGCTISDVKNSSFIRNSSFSCIDLFNNNNYSGNKQVTEEGSNIPIRLKYSEFIYLTRQGDIKKVLISPSRGIAKVTFNDGRVREVVLQQDKGLLTLLFKFNIDIAVLPDTRTPVDPNFIRLYDIAYKLISNNENLDSKSEQYISNQEEAIVILERLVKSHQVPKYLNSYYHSIGEAKENKRDIRGALDAYSKAIYIYPNDENSYNALGKINHSRKYYKEAIVCYDKSINIKNNNSNSYLLRGKSKVEIGNLLGAISDFDKGIKYDSRNNYFSYMDRANAKQLYGDIKGACIDWNIALDQSIIFSGKDATNIASKYLSKYCI